MSQTGRLISLTLLCAGLAAPAIRASPAEWISVKLGKTSVYTMHDALPAIRALETFTRLGLFFANAGPFRTKSDSSLKVIAFSSEKEFVNYRINAGSCAFYQRTRSGNYIVLQDLSAEHADVVAHEFTHFVMTQAGYTLPLWMNEGLADFYSTVEVNGDAALVGQPAQGRLQVLHSETWLSLSKLLAVDHGSPYYNERAKMILFYSESWALAHMLVNGPLYSEKFPYFLRAVSEGRTAGESFLAVYNKTLVQVEADLVTYVDQPQLPTQSIRLDGAASAGFMQPVVSKVDPSEMDFTLADIKAANPNAEAAAASLLTEVADRHPDSPAADESLALLALRQGRTEEARLHFRRAVERHSIDATTLFYLAYLDHNAGVANDLVVPLLKRAIALRPDYYDATLELGFICAIAKDYSGAIATLSPLTNPHPEHAFSVSYTIANSLAQLEEFTASRSRALQAIKLASTSNEKDEAENLILYLDQHQQLVASR